MIEIIVLQYLQGKLNVPVFMEEPKEQRPEYVLIEKTGSGRENCINSATFAIQSYSASLYGAASLNEEVKTAMDAIVNVTDVSKSSLNSDYNFTDTTKKKYRYQAIYELYY